MASGSLIQNMIRAARLDKAFYNEVEQNTSYNGQALTVVVIAALAGGIGNLGKVFSSDQGFVAVLLGALIAVVWAIVGYFVWSWLTYFIGTRLFNGTATFNKMRRPIGFAYTPAVLAVFGFIPCVGRPVAVVGALWALVAGILAIREALDFDTGDAVLTAIIGWLAVFIVSAILATLFGVGTFALGPLSGALS